MLEKKEVIANLQSILSDLPVEPNRTRSEARVCQRIKTWITFLEDKRRIEIKVRGRLWMTFRDSEEMIYIPPALEGDGTTLSLRAQSLLKQTTFELVFVRGDTTSVNILTNDETALVLQSVKDVSYGNTVTAMEIIECLFTDLKKRGL